MFCLHRFVLSFNNIQNNIVLSFATVSDDLQAFLFSDESVNFTITMLIDVYYGKIQQPCSQPLNIEHDHKILK